MSNDISISPWLGGKQWVYSITFDEALSELHQFSVPILEEFNAPGHLEVVVGQMGQVRRLMQSSYNGMSHMGAGELKDMLARGWGVGNHSWSHTYINLANIDRELGEANRVLEEAIQTPVTVYCSPGGNFNMVDEVLEGCLQYGLIGAMSLNEALNRPGDGDLLWLNRTFLHDQGPDTFDCEFDPFRKIQHAQRDQGWIIDYCHCPMEEAIHPRKDCSAAQLRERIATVVAEGGDQVWLAKVEDPLDYRYTRRATKINEVSQDKYELTTLDISPRVQSRVVTLEIPDETRRADLDGKELVIYKNGGKQLVDVDMSRERLLSLYTI